jgi:hypothetical protein
MKSFITELQITCIISECIVYIAERLKFIYEYLLTVNKGRKKVKPERYTQSLRLNLRTYVNKVRRCPSWQYRMLSGVEGLRVFYKTKNVVFWDMVLCRSHVNRRFGATYRLHLQVRKILKRGTSVSRWLQTEPVGNSLLMTVVPLSRIFLP